MDAAATAAAVLVTVVVTGLVWHSTRLTGLDAWVLRLLGAHSGERRFQVATGLRALTLSGIVATALVSWMALRRWNAVALAVLAPAVTLAVYKLLKPLVARRAPASTVFHYPSGHVTVATALALSLVLILRSTLPRPRAKALVGLCAALLVSLMAWARLVETAHLLTDDVGGASTGVAATLWAPSCCSIAAQSGADSSSSMHRVSGNRAYSGLTASTGSATTAAATRKSFRAVIRTPNRIRPPTAPRTPATLIQPATVARMPVGNSSAASAPIAGANTDAATTARRYPPIAAAGEP
jgi:membrane-associated phospholipid phosphatase